MLLILLRYELRREGIRSLGRMVVYRGRKARSHCFGVRRKGRRRGGGEIELFRWVLLPSSWRVDVDELSRSIKPRRLRKMRILRCRVIIERSKSSTVDSEWRTLISGQSPPSILHTLTDTTTIQILQQNEIFWTRNAHLELLHQLLTSSTSLPLTDQEARRGAYVISLREGELSLL